MNAGKKGATAAVPFGKKVILAPIRQLTTFQHRLLAHREEENAQHYEEDQYDEYDAGLGTLPSTGPGITITGDFFIGTNPAATSVILGIDRALVIDNTTAPPTVSINGSATNQLPVGGVISTNNSSLTQLAQTSVVANLTAGMVLQATKCCLITCLIPPYNSTDPQMCDTMVIETTPTTVPFNASINSIMPVGADMTFLIDTPFKCTITHVGKVWTLTITDNTATGTIALIELTAAGVAAYSVSTNSVAGVVGGPLYTTISNSLIQSLPSINSSMDEISIQGPSGLAVSIDGTWQVGETVTITNTLACRAATAVWTPADKITRLS
jgi:hypothetical protein